MLSVRVAIVGGGLAGLYAAALLEARGVTDYVLLEARETFGGRIMSVPVAAEPDAQRDAAERFDLGATWFWPAMQPELLRVVTAFGVEAFEQYETGAMLVERARDQPAMRIDAGASMSGAWRMAGGMGALTDAISRRLDAARLRAGWRVQRLRKVDEGVDVEAEDGVGRARCWRAAQVLLAMPPRLAVRTVAFAPALPDVLALPWAACQTWMAPHAKYLAVYDMPFWREQGYRAGRGARPARWPRSTTRRGNRAALRCSAFWACRRRRAAGWRKPICGRLAGLSWCDCSASARDGPAQSFSRIGRTMCARRSTPTGARRAATPSCRPLWRMPGRGRTGSSA